MTRNLENMTRAQTSYVTKTRADIPTTIEVGNNKPISLVEEQINKEEKRSVSDVFKDRLMSFAKTRTSEMFFTDKMERRDPHHASDYAQLIFENLRREELELGIKADYLQTV